MRAIEIELEAIGIGVAGGLGLGEAQHGLLIGLLRVQQRQIIDIAEVAAVAGDLEAARCGCLRRIGGGASVGVVFFLILVAVMPFALGPDHNLLARLGPAILWIAALLATLLGLDRLFQADHEDGSLDILVNSSLSLELVVLIKCLAHWTASALPLIVVSPLFGLMLAMAPTPFAAPPHALPKCRARITLPTARGSESGPNERS